MEKRLLFYFYAIYVVFLITYYNANFAIMYAVLLLIFFIKHINKIYGLHFRLSKSIILLIINILLIPILGVCWREIALLLWCVLLIPIVKNVKVEKMQFVNFVNLTYACYLVLSICVTFNIIPPASSLQDVDLNQFEDELGGYNIITLIGFGGSTANIDSYSVVVAGINLVFNNKWKYKYPFTLLSLTAVLLTTRLTPIYSMVIAATIFFCRYNFLIIIYKKCIAILPLLSFCIVLFYPNNNFLYDITHARNVIWQLYLDMYSWNNIDIFLFGFRQQHLPEVFLSVWQGAFSNPHSSYLRIFMSWGFIMYLFFSFFMYKCVHSVNEKKYLFLIALILVCATTNQTILWNDNPIYILTLLYIFYCLNNDSIISYYGNRN